MTGARHLNLVDLHNLVADFDAGAVEGARRSYADAYADDNAKFRSAFAMGRGEYISPLVARRRTNDAVLEVPRENSQRRVVIVLLEDERERFVMCYQINGRDAKRIPAPHAHVPREDTGC